LHKSETPEKEKIKKKPNRKKENRKPRPQSTYERISLHSAQPNTPYYPDLNPNHQINRSTTHSREQTKYKDGKQKKIKIKQGFPQGKVQKRHQKTN
jgi:hypothetical protein